MQASPGFNRNSLAIPGAEASRAAFAGLSHAQEALLFWDRIAPHTPVYNVPIAYELHGRLNLRALEQALNAIVARHEILRSTYQMTAERPRYSVSRNAKIEVKVVDWNERSPTNDSPSLLLEAVKAEARRPFALSKDLMLRAAVFRRSETNNVLLLTLHHIASDGWSLGVLITELLELYSSYCQGSSAQLDPLPLQYSDYAMWSRSQLQGGELERLVSFWRQELTGAGWHQLLPRERTDGAQDFSGETIRATVPRELAERLTQLGQQSAATNFMVMLCALQVLLYRLSDCDDFATGVAVANRTKLEFSGLIGCFVNALPIRTKISKGMTFRDLLRQTRETFLRGFAHQELPFSEMVRQLHPRRVPGGSPFFQVQFLYQSYPMPEFRAPDLIGIPLDVDTGTAKFDLTVVVEKRDQTKIAFEYNTAFWRTERMSNWMDLYLAILRDAGERPDRAVSELCCAQTLHCELRQ